MSLTDSLLLEGYRDPHDVWIALRTDGVKGSGTIDDPYDGGTRLGPAMAASITCDRAEFVVDGGGALPGLQVGTVVTFAYVKGPAADWFNTPSAFVVTEILESRVFPELDGGTHPFRCVVESSDNPPLIPPAPPAPQFSWNGPYQINYTAGGVSRVVGVSIRWPVARVTTAVPHGLRAYAAVKIDNVSDGNFAGDYPVIVSDAPGQTNVFRYRLTFLPSDDLLPSKNPDHLACTVTKIIHRFDEVMRSVPTYSVIHLGPGTFETRGTAPAYIASADYLDLYVGYVMQSGQRLVGSGRGATVVKLVLAADDNNETLAIANNAYPVADYAEVTDLTVDCNAPGQVAPHGIFPAPVTCAAVGLGGQFIRVHRVRAINFCAQGPSECFPLGILPHGTGNPPGVFNIIEDCIVEKPGENNTHETTLISVVGDNYGSGRSLIERHNYHNCEFANGWFTRPVPIASLQRDATDTTLAILTTSQAHTHLKGKALVVQGAKTGGSLSTIYNGIFSIEEITSETVLKYRLYNDPGTGSVDVTGASIGWPISTEQVAVAALTLIGGDPTHFKVTTKRPHNRLAGQNVRLNNVRIGSATGPYYDFFNNTFKVSVRNSDTELTCESPETVPTSPTAIIDVAYIGVDFFGRGALSGTGCVTEGNAFYNCVYGLYQDTGSTRDIVVRDNYCSNVSLGVYFNFRPDTFDAFRGASAIVPENAPEDSGHKHGVFTTIQPHGLSVTTPFTKVVIREAGSTAPDPSNPYHGTNLEVVATRGDYEFIHRLANQSAPLPLDNCPGRPVFKSAVAISSSAGSLTYTHADQKVTVTTGTNHNLVTDDFVTIFGASLSSFDGFVGPVTVISPTQFSFLQDLGTSDLSGSGGIMDRHVAAGITRNGSVATVTTALPHGYFLGQVIKVQNAYVNSVLARYNGVVTVEPLTERTFSYEMKSGSEPDPTLSKSPTGQAEYAAHWDIRHLVFENNIYDLYAADNNTAIFPIGASMFGLFEPDTPPYIFPAFIYRGNIIRHIDGHLPAGTAQPSYGIFASTIGGGIIEQNVIDVSAANPLTYSFIGKITQLENKTTGGSLIHGTNLHQDQSVEPIDDLETRIADALALALL